MRRFGGFGGLVLCLAWGCGSKSGAAAPNLGDCTTCNLNAGGTPHHSADADAEAEASATSDDAAKRAVAAVTITLSPITVNTDATFAKDPTSFAGAVKVSSFDPQGAVVDTGPSGVVLSQMLPGVASGPNWFAVEDTSMPPTLASTLQPVTVDTKDSAISLTAINVNQLATSNIDGQLLGGLTAGETTVVLVFRRGGKGVSGISVTGNPATSTVAYYTGKSGTPYETQDNATNATGADSTVMVAHIPVSAHFPSLNKVTLICTINQATFNVDAQIAQNFVTWMFVEVP